MMEKFDSIYADSVNDEIEFDVVFGGEGSLIESVDPEYFFDECGEEKIDESTKNKEEEKDDEEKDEDVKECKKEASDISTMDDFDSFLEGLDDDIENDGDPGDMEDTSINEDDDDDDEDDDDDDDEGYTGYRSTDDDDDDNKLFDRDQTEYRPSGCEEKPNTIGDLDRQISRYDDVEEPREYQKQVLHSSEADKIRDAKTIDDLDRYTNTSVNEDDDDDNHLIDKIDNDDGHPDEEATPADFHRPEDNYQDNSFETRDELKEAITISDLDSAIIGLVPTGQSTLGSNIGLDTEESEQPDSEDSLNDGEDIDAIMKESFFFD